MENGRASPSIKSVVNEIEENQICSDLEYPKKSCWNPYNAAIIPMAIVKCITCEIKLRLNANAEPIKKRKTAGPYIRNFKIASEVGEILKTKVRISTYIM
jgi:hypothetical protein